MMGHAATHRDDDGGSKPALYVVATPIGNLRDITLRALEVLKEVDVVAAEDTRVTARLFNHYGIATRLIALHEHNEQRMVSQVLALLATGKSVALVSDAGTPAISDPGARVVAAAAAAGYSVTPIPGASAVVAALAAAGMSAPHFLFCGFLPARGGERRRGLAGLSDCPHVIVFFEAPHRIAGSVSDMLTAFGGERRIVIARELTKLFETIRAGTLAEAAARLQTNADQRKGEYVLIVEGAAKTGPAGDGINADHVLETLLAELPLRQAVVLATRITAAGRNTLYARALKLKEEP